MRAWILCTLAMFGCARARPAPKVDEGFDAHPAELTSADAGAPVDPLAPLAIVDASVFVPSSDGGVSEVLRKDAPNMRYAKLDRGACFAELGRRGIAFEEVSMLDPPSRPHRLAAKTAPKKKSVPPKPRAIHPAPVAAKPLPTHLLAPLRLRGPLHGVAIHSGLSEKQREHSTIEIFDCRLVLALDDFAATLAERGIVEVVHMSAFRSDSERGCTTKYSGKQHCGALAVDVGVFKKNDGTTLEVDRDYHGKIGRSTCTAGSGPEPATPAAVELRSIVCDAAGRGLFHVMLTPNFNEEHRNHFHLEITPGVDWMLVH